MTSRAEIAERADYLESIIGEMEQSDVAELIGYVRELLAAQEPLAYVDAHPWTVSTLGRFLLSCSEEEQARPVWGAYFTETKGERHARTRALSISWERVDGNFVKTRDTSLPWSMVIWTARAEGAAPLGAWQPIDACPNDDTWIVAQNSRGQFMVWIAKLLRQALAAGTPGHLRFDATRFMVLDPDAP